MTTIMMTYIILKQWVKELLCFHRYSVVKVFFGKNKWSGNMMEVKQYECKKCGERFSVVFSYGGRYTNRHYDYWTLPEDMVIESKYTYREVKL